MAKYQVVRAWHGVSVGQVVELDEVHPSLKANVMPVASASVNSSEADDMLQRARVEVEEMRKQAEAELAQRVAEAQAQLEAEAKSIIDDANAEAERIKAEAIKQAGELTPATPEAAAKQAKAK
jgi:F0F1-type ATP synthase membrane subunit b/b'